MSIKKKLDICAGRLNAESIAEGINASRANTKRLASDARLMLDAERFPTAAALAVLSIDKSGKSEMDPEIRTAC